MANFVLLYTGGNTPQSEVEGAAIMKSVDGLVRQSR